MTVVAGYETMSKSYDNEGFLITTGATTAPATTLATLPTSTSSSGANAVGEALATTTGQGVKVETSTNAVAKQAQVTVMWSGWLVGAGIMAGIRGLL